MELLDLLLFNEQAEKNTNQPPEKTKITPSEADTFRLETWPENSSEKKGPTKRLKGVKTELENLL
ncbi:hypothetical protein [Desulfonema ishimotonii]|uniref:hypothetical protein n=1 Tax=Desulfonema ishimotonii TaxID=45657 RepID=UPI000F57983A|nr:hypothetical protein [Desulfonema ishimotonii]